MFSINRYINFNVENLNLQDILSNRKYFIDKWLEVIEQDLRHQSVDDFLYQYYSRNLNFKRTTFNGENIVTVFGLFPKVFLAQLNTHRTLSKNAGSSRAISFHANVMNILTNMYLPAFTKNKKGMQGEMLEVEEYLYMLKKHLELFFNILEFIHQDIGIHKQNINRYLEPFMLTPIIVTGNYGINKYGWDNFIELRYHEAAQKEISYLARFVKENIDRNILYKSKIHHPFFDKRLDDIIDNKMNDIILFLNSEFYIHPDDDIKYFMSKFGEIARVSTMTESSVDRNFDLCIRLLKDKHMSPFEHILVFGQKGKYYYNIRSYKSFRYIIDETKKYVLIN